MESDQTLHDFVLNLLSDPQALSSFSADPEGALNTAGLGDISAADVHDAIPLVIDYAPAQAVTGLESTLSNLPLDPSDLGTGGAIQQLQALAAAISTAPVDGGFGGSALGMSAGGGVSGDAWDGLTAGGGIGSPLGDLGLGGNTIGLSDLASHFPEAGDLVNSLEANSAGTLSALGGLGEGGLPLGGLGDLIGSHPSGSVDPMPTMPDPASAPMPTGGEGGLPGVGDLPGLGDLPGVGDLPGLGDLPGVGSLTSLAGGLPGLGDLPGVGDLPGLGEGGLPGLPGLSSLPLPGLPVPGLGGLPGLGDLPGVGDLPGLGGGLPGMPGDGGMPVPAMPTTPVASGDPSGCAGSTVGADHGGLLDVGSLAQNGLLGDGAGQVTGLVHDTLSTVTSAAGDLPGSSEGMSTDDGSAHTGVAGLLDVTGAASHSPVGDVPGVSGLTDLTGQVQGEVSGLTDHVLPDLHLF